MNMRFLVNLVADQVVEINSSRTPFFFTLCFSLWIQIIRKNTDMAHFFKVVLFPLDQGLKIPIAFMRKYGNELRKMVLLKVPTGASWQVELVDRDGRTWLQKGWQAFAEFYSIKKCHFLVFRYEGNSQFHVLIFDPSATEIEYPLKVGTSDQMEEDDVSVEILDNFRENQGSKGQRPQQEMEDLQDDISVEILNDDVPMGKLRMTRSSRRLMSGSNRINKVKLENLNELERSAEGTERHLQSTIYAKDEFISHQRAKAFRSEKPFFISFMQPSYVSAPFKLSIPLAFVKNYLTYKDNECNMCLRVREHEQTWPVICKVYKMSAKILAGGWKEFAQENSLKVGDVCVFEMESCTINVFNVIIYRADEAA